ncbi:hypothetical protein EO244_00990 [Ancylomarina salipaludis]|uniref:Uncharacterized protein n=1 Tax=Ancylomarina salipaludis TaxID=2501299 RepID=A0A4Q1JQ00_9BACT|nr:hypothetical protein [Ancylomarina salipaludis]RXQ97494.1 hypothetical protein EO244_00990 [Ancylomarina salipaludis]
MFKLISKLKNKGNLWPYFFEFFTVLLSVYLAFLLTEWRENHKEQQETKLAIERLNQEIFQNYREIISFKKDVAQRLHKMQLIEKIIEPNISFNDYIGVFNGFRYVRFSTASWKRIGDSKIGNLMPVDYLDWAHDLYRSNEHLNQHNLIINDLMYSNMNFDPKKCKIAYHIAELYVWQQAVWAIDDVYNYTQFIQKYKQDFEYLLKQDSTVNAYFISRDSLTPDKLKDLLKKEAREINSLRKSEKMDAIRSKIKSLKTQAVQ